MTTPLGIEKRILAGIGYFYFYKVDMEIEKNKTDDPKNYQPLEDMEQLCNDTISEIKLLGIHGITYVEETKTFEILLDRPGVLIGMHGDDIEMLMEYLREDLKEPELKIKIEEDRKISHLFDFTYAFCDFNDYPEDYDY
jgi:ribosomal protein S3